MGEMRKGVKHECIQARKRRKTYGINRRNLIKTALAGAAASGVKLTKEKRGMKTFGINRRNLIKTALAGCCGRGIESCGMDQQVRQPKTRNPQIGIAGYAYDRVRAIQDGRLGLDGYDVNFHVEDIYAVNRYVFGPEKKYEVSEIGLIPYLKKYANEDFRAYTLIPVFISRIFRHRNVFVHADSGIKTPQDLRGKRVGTPGYGMSANTWIRGFLLDEYGVKADDFEWIETTKSSDAGKLGGGGWDSFKKDGSSRNFYPADFPIKLGPPGVDESELLLSGGCDALITAITPKAFLDKHPKVKRLYPNFRAGRAGVLLQDAGLPHHACGRHST